MVLNARDFNIIPNGTEEQWVLLWPAYPARYMPVWLALQILLNRLARDGGGTLYLPAADNTVRSGLASGTLASYNLGDHPLVIAANIELRGDGPSHSADMGYDDSIDPGILNYPLWSGRNMGSPPETGTIIESSSTTGPVIHVFCTKYAQIRNLAIVAPNLSTVAVSPHVDSTYEPHLYVYLANPSKNNVGELYEIDTLAPTMQNGRWWVDGADAVFLDLSDQRINDTNGKLNKLPFLTVKWRNSVGHYYDPKEDDALRNEWQRDYPDYKNCALHLNSAWHTVVENVLIFTPKKAVGILVDCLYRDLPNGTASNPYPFVAFDPNDPNKHRPRIYTDSRGDCQIFGSYFTMPRNDDWQPVSGDEGDAGSVVISSEEISGWGGGYNNRIQNVKMTASIFAVIGNNRGDAVTVCTFSDIWARRYVVRYTMALTFQNCTAEGFAGQSPPFTFPDINDFDSRITQGNPSWWNELWDTLINKRFQYFDGRETGYLISDTDTIVLSGCDIEDTTAASCIILGDGVDSFNGIGISTGLQTMGEKASMIGKPIKSGSFIPNSDDTIYWGRAIELLRYSRYGGSGEAYALFGARNETAVDDGMPYQYKIRSSNYGIDINNDPYDGRHSRETFEVIQINSGTANPRTFLTFDRGSYASKNKETAGQTSLANLIQLNAEMTTGDSLPNNRINLIGDILNFIGVPHFVHEDVVKWTSSGGTPSLSGFPNTPKGYLVVRVANSSNQNEQVYIPFYQP